MHIKLGNNVYGKYAINLSKLVRHPGHHEFRQISVNVTLEGDFETAHTIGDNSKILPTDTQKNTVYALAKDHFNSSIEAFGIFLSHHFHSNNPQLSGSTIEITEHLYNRIYTNGQPHPHAYISSGIEKHTTTIRQEGTKVSVHAGIRDLMILKTTDSGFEHYIKDKFTTLKETSDRIMATQCEANWTYYSANNDFNPAYQKIRQELLDAFAEHKSLSVQHTLYYMGEEVLKKNPEVKEISLIMPNKHQILFNLEPFGLQNNNEVFIATDEPYGYISGTIVRDSRD